MNGSKHHIWSEQDQTKRWEKSVTDMEKKNGCPHCLFLVICPWKLDAHLCDVERMREMSTVPPPHCEMPVAPQLSPEVKIDYCRRTVCPALYTLHTHHFSIISIIHWGGGECVRSYSHTHTQTHIGLEALTGLLAKGQSHESDKSFFGETKTYHNQINWKDKCSYFSFLFVFPSVSEYFCVDVSLSVKMKKPV